MSNPNLEAKIDEVKKEASASLHAVKGVEDLQAFYEQFLGKKGLIAPLLRNLRNLTPEDKKIWGPKIQVLRYSLQEEYDQRLAKFEAVSLNEKLEQEWIDVTQEYPWTSGSLHPMSQVQRRVEEIFTGLGFTIADGPEVETEWHNFDALNIPHTHPARDMQDTFFVSTDSEDSKQNSVLRTHTSCVQIRELQKHGAPLRIIVPGRVYRNEDVDATHDAVFYQVEGLMVDRHITLVHLKGVLRTMLSELFQRDVKVRIRPGYFPFVEPGLEVDFSCLLCNGQGCKTCKGIGWIEFMGAGMVHPNVLRHGGVDPEEYSGFAFGFGLTRLVMMKYGIDDIRRLFSLQKDFLGQF